MIFDEITSNPEWYLENYHPSEWEFSIHRTIFKKNLKTRMILRKCPPLRMTVLYSPYDIWKLTSKPEWHLENNHPSEWQFSIHLIIFEKVISKHEWYLENDHPSKWVFSIHRMVFQNNLITRMILRKQPPVRMTVLYSTYNIRKITSKPEWYLENNHP